jgi:two-component system nitrate/nitrite response regulator NarL
MSDTVRVAVCDDHQVVIEGLKLILTENKGVEIVGMFQDPYELIGFLNHEQNQADVVITDAHLGNNLNGIDLLSKVNQFERFRWILFSSYVDKYLAFQAEKAGFQACLSKEVPSHVLISLIGNITQDRFVCYPPFAGDDQAKKRIENLHNAIDSLTKRERQVMDILMQGLNSKECAERLHISIFTFETHKKNIFRKLDINSTSELMRIAMDFKFV